MASEAAGEASSEWLPSEAYDPTYDPTFQADSHQPAPPIYVGLYSGVLVNVVLAANLLSCGPALDVGVFAAACWPSGRARRAINTYS